jgi:hypothetical protein
MVCTLMRAVVFEHNWCPNWEPADLHHETTDETI